MDTTLAAKPTLSAGHYIMDLFRVFSGSSFFHADLGVGTADPRSQQALLQRMRDLNSRLRLETDHLSAPEDVCEHPAYRALVNIGPAAVPLILREMRRDAGHWPMILADITQEEMDLPDEECGRIDAVVSAWLRWGKKNGLTDD